MTQSATEAQPKAKKNKLSSGFFRFVLTRFLLIIPTVFILVTIVFFVMRYRRSDFRRSWWPSHSRGTAEAYPRGRL
mgnify:CR=1 FL=1